MKFFSFSFFIAALAALIPLSSMAENKTASITVDSRVTYQHVSGFGGFSPSPTWSYWLSDAQMDQLFGNGDDQLGLNILRLYMANDKQWWNSGLANAKRAKKHGAFIFASPWSPQASWKSNGSDSNGGSLLEEHWGDWAEFLNNYYLYMKEQGVTIDAVSIQNEPDWKAEYQSCIWTGEQMAKFLRLHGSKITCKVIAPEAIHFTKSMHEPILNDDKACANLDIVGGHFYGWDGSSYPLAAEKGKEVWMTEYLINERQQNENKNIDWVNDGFLFARNINDAMLANISAWVHYSLKRYYGVIGDGKYGTVDNQITKRGYVLSQFAKYVSGTTRIRHSLSDASGKLFSSAYITEDGANVVVMLSNPSADSYTTTVTLPVYASSATQVTTSADLNASKSTLSFSETYTPQVELKPYSVNTFIFAKTKERTDLPDIETGTSVFADGFDVAGGGSVPQGWVVKWEDGTRKAGNYGLGPRIMTFSAEGDMQYAFYFRTNATADGYISYGEEADYRLHLEPGKYTLSYSTMGWKATPQLTATISTVSGVEVASMPSTPSSFISENGSSARITSATDKAIDFEVTTAGDFILKWTVAKSDGGLNEMLVGNIKLVSHSSSNAIEDILIDKDNFRNDNCVYDLMGRKVNVLQKNTIYICNGKKFIVR